MFPIDPRHPPHSLCREYAIDHLRIRLGWDISNVIADALPWDRGVFELVLPVDLVPREVATWSDLKPSLATTKELFGTWMYPAERLGRRLRDLIGRAGFWLAFYNGVSEASDIEEFELKGVAMAVPAGRGTTIVVDARIPDDRMVDLFHICGAAWGLILMIGRDPMPSFFDESVIRDHVELLVMIAHDGDAFLLWRRAS